MPCTAFSSFSYTDGGVVVKSRSSVLGISPLLAEIITCAYSSALVPMFAPDAHDAPNIALITLVAGWVFTAVAFLSVILLIWCQRHRDGSLSLDHYLLFSAFTITVSLVVHTSWAVVDEGLGIPRRQISETQRASLIKVGYRDRAGSRVILIDWMAVDYGK